MKKLGINSIIVTSGTLLAGFLGIAFFVIVARDLGPANFGTFSVIVALSVIISDIFDFGLNTSIVRFISGVKESEKAHFVQNFLSYKLILALLVIVLGVLFGPLLSKLILKNEANSFLVWLGFLGAGTSLIFGFFTSVLNANKKFFSSSMLNILSNLLRIVLVLILKVFQQSNIQNILFVFSIVLIILPLIWLLVERSFSVRPIFAFKTFLKIFAFSKWLALSNGVGTISSRVDNFLLYQLTSAFETGVYTSVQRAFLSLNQITGSLSTVLAPDFASGDKKRVLQGLKFGLLASAILSFGSVVLIIIAPIVVPLVLGNSYLRSIDPFRYLCLGAIFTFLSLPFNSFILYCKGQSAKLFIITLVQFAFALAFNLFLIPTRGASGAAISFIGVSAIGFVFSLGYYFKLRD